jgi:hypothetical protein
MTSEVSTPLTLSQEDATAIAEVLAQADGGCSNCALELAEQMQAIAPAHNWVALVRKAGGWYV